MSKIALTNQHSPPDIYENSVSNSFKNYILYCMPQFTYINSNNKNNKISNPIILICALYVVRREWIVYISAIN